MAVEYFLKIDGIQGESVDAKHKGEIELESFGVGVDQTAAHLGAGGHAGKARFTDFHFVARASKASPQLFLACAGGRHIANALLTCRRGDAAKQEFLHMKMGDVRVSSYAIKGEDAGFPQDEVSLNYLKLELEYKAQKPDGSLGQSTKAGWNLKLNEKF
jgi:type VI secretion system secreted protein Hcp